MNNHRISALLMGAALSLPILASTVAPAFAAGPKTMQTQPAYRYASSTSVAGMNKEDGKKDGESKETANGKDLASSKPMIKKTDKSSSQAMMKKTKKTKRQGSKSATSVPTK